MSHLSGGNARDQATQEKEKLYHDFLRLVHKFLREDVSTEEWHGTAMFIYKELIADRPETDRRYHLLLWCEWEC